MKVKLLFLFLGIMILLTGCSESSTEKAVKTDGEYESLTIKLNVRNKEAKADSYLVFILNEGTKETEPGKATQTSLQKIETNSKGEAVISLSYNFNLESGLKKSEKDRTKLEIIVTTKEDIYMRNPLNEKTLIEFVKNYDEETMYEFPYLSVIENKTIDIVDKYPDGVISLSFPDATFVIKLEFEEGFTPLSSYLVSIHKPDPRSKDGIGIVRIGRLDRKFQYWETPFFKTDKLEEWNGYIIIEDTDDKRIIYKDYPKFVEFDKNGKGKNGDVITIKMPS